MTAYQTPIIALKPRIIALDVGKKRIGIAVSDPTGTVALPFETIERDESAASRLAKVIGSFGAEKLVIGLPLNMDGTEGERARDVRSFAGIVRQLVDVPIVFVDERLTTVQAESLTSKGVRDRRARKRASDRVAAAIILRAYLDSVGSSDKDLNKTGEDDESTDCPDERE